MMDRWQYTPEQESASQFSILRKEYGYVGIRAVGISQTGEVIFWTDEKEADKILKEAKFGTNQTRIIEHQPVTDALSAPLKVFFDPSKICPLSCSFCLAGVQTLREQRMSVPNLNRESALIIADQIISMGALQVKIGGGEPFVFPWFYEIVELFSKSGIAVSTSTSGFNLNNIPEPDLSRLREANLKISVSIDGEPDYHNKVRGSEHIFQDAIAGIKRLVQMGYPSKKIEIRSTLIHSPQSYEQLGFLQQLSSEFGLKTRIRQAKPTGSAQVNGIAVIYPDPLYWQSHDRMRQIASEYPDLNFDELVDYDKKNELQTALDCGAGTRSAFVSADGHFLPCGFINSHFQYQSHDPKFEDKNLLELWQSGEAFVEVRKYLKMQNELSSCRHCKHVHSCQGGCPSVRLTANTDIDPRCPTRRRLFLPAICKDQSERVTTSQISVATGSIMFYYSESGQKYLVLVGETNQKGQLIIGSPGGTMEFGVDKTLDDTLAREIAEELSLQPNEYTVLSTQGLPTLVSLINEQQLLELDLYEITGNNFPRSLLLSEPFGGVQSAIAVYDINTHTLPQPGGEIDMVLLIPESQITQMMDFTDLNQLIQRTGVDGVIKNSDFDRNKDYEVVYVGTAKAIATGRLDLGKI